MRPALSRSKLKSAKLSFDLWRVAVVGILFAMAQMPVAVAQDANSPLPDQTIEEPSVPEISRDGWRARIEEARRRSKEVATERRSNPTRFEPPPQEDIAQIATERVLSDDSLQFGDIVSTRNGLFVFRGQSDRQRRPEDFVALPPR